MPRRSATGMGGLVLHVMNRAARRAVLFEEPGDYAAFLRVLVQAAERVPMRLLAYAVMPNHFHLLVWPREDRDLARYMQWVTRTHAQRWHLAHQSVGSGALYQGRYRAVPVQNDRHFLVACRYVERNPARAGLVQDATTWRWSSAWRGESRDRPPLAAWPIPRPEGWAELLTAVGSPEEHLDGIRDSTKRGVPFGNDGWAKEIGARLAMTGRLRGRGRPARAVGGGKN